MENEKTNEGHDETENVPQETPRQIRQKAQDAWLEKIYAEKRVKEQVDREVNKKENTVREQTIRRKKMFLKIYERTMGTITVACDKAGINRQTFYNWKDSDKDFAKAVQAINNQRIDRTEDRMLKLLQRDDGPTIRWYLDRVSEIYRPKNLTEHAVSENSFTDMVDTLLTKLDNKKDDAGNEKQTAPADEKPEV